MQWIARSLVLGILIVLVACGSPATAEAPAAQSASASGAVRSAAAGAAVLTLVKPDGGEVPFGAADLQKLPLVSVMSDGQPQEGPAVDALIKAAGVTGYSSVTITGAEGTRTLAAAEITPDLILDFNNRGGVKLVSPSLEKDNRLRDVSRIEVK